VTDADAFFARPVLNSPYVYPRRHWELDASGQPTQKIAESRRAVSFVTPIPKPKKRRAKDTADVLVFEDIGGISTRDQQYETQSIIGEVRKQVDAWRNAPHDSWHVTPETARLLNHWRHHQFEGVRPFFCQVEAVETAIWLTEVAPHHKPAKYILDHLAQASRDANPDLSRLALKLATGAGKTTVMAMLIAWQTLNAIRHSGSKQFTRAFLIVAPGLTIKDRLRVLKPNDPDSYYATRDIVPSDLRGEMLQAKVVVTNYHAFKLRERVEISAGGRALLKGRTGEDLDTTENEGQMIQRVMPELMGSRRILVLNDEAHHCYREKPRDTDDDASDDGDEALVGDARKEAERNNDAARVWISGLEAVNRKLGVARVIDLSATPFFLAGSGYAEGTLFPWTMSDFSLMDAIECGIVKLPRVPVAENIPGAEMPVYRNLWEHIRKDMPKKGRGKGAALDPGKLPTKLVTALEALYGHYAKTFELWQKAGTRVPPCFIVVCQNTAISKLVFDYVAGYHRENEDGTTTYVPGRLPLFRNFDDYPGNALPRPRTLLIDSEQLEAGDALDPSFREMAADELERFRRERAERYGAGQVSDEITDQELLREVMNTVGKEGQLGASIRCVVSVSMLTEGWDANNVTHILGIRAFGTQLLCEQVIGRALRRQSYELNEQQLFDPEYADIFGIPFDFTAKPVVAPPKPPAESVQVRAVRPDRDHLEIRFPRVEGYRVELPNEKLSATFTADSVLELSPAILGPTQTLNSAIIGEQTELTLAHLATARQTTIVYHLARCLLLSKWRDAGGEPKLYLFGQLKRIAKQWLDICLVCKGGTYPAMVLYDQFLDTACERITKAIVTAHEKSGAIKVLLDPYNPTGTTADVRFATARQDRWETNGPPPKNHVNWVVLDSDWEAELCRAVERHPRVVSYTKNHNLGLEVPYLLHAEPRRYRPDFIVRVDDGRGETDLLNLVVEIKGYRGEDAKEKKSTMETYWVPGVNNLGTFGRWAFAEFTEVYTIDADLSATIDRAFRDLIESAAPLASTTNRAATKTGARR
jgi:type III restriction enzyme